MPTEVNARPSKEFFVKGLTRDIHLKDAILDLLDNCVDGVVRQTQGKARNGRPYKDYWAKITASPTQFAIEDNCGGISKQLAINNVFRLGRPDQERDRDIPTVGMYGIGMKRALFKLGTHSIVTSKNNDDAYKVEISPEWLDNDVWTLEMQDAKVDWEYDGTSIVVGQLHANIAEQFGKKNTFLDDLQKEISSLFALIMKKGLAVYLNNVLIEPVHLVIFAPADYKNDLSIRPYAYKETVNDVDIRIVVGFYRKPPDDDELEEEEQIARKTVEAGWTVICNDRIVLSRDRTPLTGWGMANVPHYHPQYGSIAGVVRFSSNNSFNLPINSTKRGLDTSSSVYWHALNYMMEGTKKFTDFTNHWKGRKVESIAKFEGLTPKDATEITDEIPEAAWGTIRGSDQKGKRFIPELPRPTRDDDRSRISFSRLKKEIRLLAMHFYDDPDAKPNDVGNRCFDEALERARKRK